MRASSTAPARRPATARWRSPADASSTCSTPPAPPRRPAAPTRVIDAEGRVVAPGFIDTHSHSDMPLVTDGNAQSKIRQGVTTEVIGESGSIAPQPVAHRRSAVDRLRRLLRRAREAGHLGEPAVVRRPRHGARAGHRRRQPPAHRRRAGEDAGHRHRRDAAGRRRASRPASSTRPTPTRRSTSWSRSSTPAAAVGGRYASHLRHDGKRLREGIEEGDRDRRAGEDLRCTCSTSRSPASRTSAA